MHRQHAVAELCRAPCSRRVIEFTLLVSTCGDYRPRIANQTFRGTTVQKVRPQRLGLWTYLRVNLRNDAGTDTAEAIRRLGHRTFVGGEWDTIGKLQFDFIVRQGLEPRHVLLDIGCGALRGGRFFIEYL